MTLWMYPEFLSYQVILILLEIFRLVAAKYRSFNHLLLLLAE